MPGFSAQRPFPRSARLVVVLCLAWMLSACGLLHPKNEPTQEEPPKDAAAEAGLTGKPIPYKVHVAVHGVDKDVQADLAGKMKDASNLVHLAKKPPDSLLGLESRARDDRATAVKLLHSQGYYDGEADFVMDEATSPVAVTLNLTPKALYTVGRADIVYDPAPEVPEALRHRRRATGLLGLDERILPPPYFPESLPGVDVGKPITADAMLAAVESIIPPLQRDGYPLARISESRYTLDREKKLLNADIVVDTGPPARLGPINVFGNQQVNAGHIRDLTLWEAGVEPWDNSLLEDYANNLRTSGLFRTVTAKPNVEAMHRDKDGMAVLPVDVTVAEAPFRTLEASAKYDTDTGFGVEGGWTHRNLFGNGEKLKLTAPITTQLQGLKAAFDKPAFFSREQTFKAYANALRETTEAYEEKTLKSAAGVERRLTRHAYASLGLEAEGGTLKPNEQEERAYAMAGPRLTLRHDNRDHKLNPTEGTEIRFSVKPFTGYFENSFSAVAGTFSASAYYAPLPAREGKPNDWWVLAGRVEAGTLMGAPLDSMPTNLRYFAGGAGSVRGYVHQSVGPRDDNGEPMGGRSYQLVSLESRFKVAENIGIVPFLDGGMAYKDELPQLSGKMDWGAGLGLRYYTPIGPLRLDVAAPMQPKAGDPPVQLYISVGQAF